ncbi:MAG: hypothetical protein US18_C0007G0017 [Parcubacteria group bacterium GW2011_GWB1_36_5]|nr:MAG: hypothetical protein US12_C0044G0001 [Parcubacteria group bacterium GW2011_GWA2_36_24]KKQ07819.1 MAG: hypothetical protein US18_C0007G0017 [Parcubacteria group bacterium GW2011_GWB1_36_5]
MKEDSVYLNHILDSIKNVFSDTKNFTLEKFLGNRQVKDAVTRNVEIIGEAVKRLSKETQQDYSDVPWQKIARTRDMLIHHYFDVDDQQLWKIVEDDLPKLKVSIEKILNKNI